MPSRWSLYHLCFFWMHFIILSVIHGLFWRFGLKNFVLIGKYRFINLLRKESAYEAYALALSDGFPVWYNKFLSENYFFKWGKHLRYPWKKVFSSILEKNLNQGSDKIHIDQQNYISNIIRITFLLSDRSCPEKTENIKDSELHRAFRWVFLELNWTCGVSHPDSSFIACYLSTVQAKPKFGLSAHIFEANKAIRELKNIHHEIVYPRLDRSSVRTAGFSWCQIR